MRIAQVSKVEQNIVFFIVGNILGRERSTFSGIMRFAQFLYVEIQPQGCDNNPETSQFLITFFIENIHFVYLWTFVCYFCATMNLSFFLLFRNMALTYEKYSIPEKYSKLFFVLKHLQRFSFS